MAGIAADDAKGSTSVDKLIAEINAGFASGDTVSVLEALGKIARSRGMSQLAREMSVSRESLYSALRRQANPSFSTVVKVMSCLGFRIRVAHPHGRSEKGGAADAARSFRR